MEEAALSEALKKYNETYNKNIVCLKPKQIQSIHEIVNAVKSDTADIIFILLRTGYGKTLVVQLARMLLKCVMVGVYPLDSIMIPAHEGDISAGLRSLIVDSEFVNHLLLYRKGCSVLSPAITTKVKMFISASIDTIHGHPENLLKKAIIEVFRSEEWKGCQVFIFLDEGHLILKWGNDYRPDYAKVPSIRDAFSASERGIPKVVVASATCPESLRKTISKLHRVPENRCVCIKMSPCRPNHFLRVKAAETSTNLPFWSDTVETPRRVSLRREIKLILRNFSSDDFPKTIIFFNNKELCGETYEMIDSEIGPISYASVVQIHADLGRHLKELTFKAIMTGHVKLILATESAGTGADFPGFERLVHWSAPRDMITYTQRKGRMRCDDKRVLCLIIYTKRDLTNPKVEDSIKRMIQSASCRSVFEEEALEFTLNEEEKQRRGRFGCCDICSPELETLPEESEDKKDYSVGNKTLVSYLLNYFEAENENTSQLESKLTVKLAKDIQKFWNAPQFRQMLEKDIDPKFMVTVREIVGWFSGAEPPVESKDMDNEYDDSTEDFDEESFSENGSLQSSDSDETEDDLNEEIV